MKYLVKWLASLPQDNRTLLDPTRSRVDSKHLEALRADVATARLEGSSESTLIEALKALEHYLAWATRLDISFKHEDMVRGFRGSREPIPGSLSVERQEVVDEIHSLGGFSA